MIKIIKPGLKEIRKKYIYTFICPHCGCEFECETEDFTEIERRLDGNAYIDCPTCGHRLDRGTHCKSTRWEEEKIHDANPIPVKEIREG